MPNSRDDNRRFLLSKQLDDNAFRFLMKRGLQQRCDDIYMDYERTTAEVKHIRLEESSSFLRDLESTIGREGDEPSMALEMLTEKARQLYPYECHIARYIP